MKSIPVFSANIDLDARRIYDRILEVRVPILFDGENFRKGNAVENLKMAASLPNNSKQQNPNYLKVFFYWEEERN